jgi:hypothetical protein
MRNRADEGEGRSGSAVMVSGDAYATHMESLGGQAVTRG